MEESRAAYPDDWRFAADNMWTGGSVEELLPALRRIAETLPGPPSHAMWTYWGGSQPKRPDMAYSIEAEIYIALYAVWLDPAQDEAHAAWPSERIREVEHLSSGIRLGDESLDTRPDRFLAEEQRQRLEGIRARYDPHARFHVLTA